MLHWCPPFSTPCWNFKPVIPKFELNVRALLQVYVLHRYSPASDRFLPVVQVSHHYHSLTQSYIALVIAFLTSCFSVLFRFTARCGKVCNIWSNTRCRFYCIHSLGPYFVFVLASSSKSVRSPPFPVLNFASYFFLVSGTFQIAVLTVASG